MRVWVVLTALFAGVLAQNENLYKLNIIHYNDFHAHFDEISTSGSTCRPDEECIGGLSRLYTAMRQALEDEPDSIVLNGGDTFQGTVWYNFMRWNVTQYFMNLLPKHDAHVLGNHEFDHGIEGLLPYLERLDSVMLGANVNTTLEPELGQYVKNHVIVERNNRKIGIIGILLQTFSADIGRVIMEDELEAVNREAAILTEQGVDIIIVLSHVGYDSDQRLAANMSPDVDIIVGAHSHTLLFNGEAPLGSPAGPYPTVVTQDNGHRILIVQASHYTRYLGDITLYFDAQGKIVSWDGHPIYLGTSIIKDERMERELDVWRADLYPISREVLGSAVALLNRGRCFRGECNLGSWVCEAFLEQVLDLAEGDNWGYAHLCMINAGGVRVPIERGEVTTEALLMAVPFENTVQVYDLKGKYILEAIEFALGVQQSDLTSFYSSRMLQFAGMRNVYNASAPIGSRVLSASVRCIECDIPRYLPLEPEKTYRILTQDYIGDGGGGYSMLVQNRENLKTFDIDYIMLQNHMRKYRLFFQDLDGRIEIVY